MRDINMTFCFAHSVAEKTLKRFSFHIKNRCPWIQFPSVAPDLSRRRKHFLNKKRERERWDCKLIFSLFLLLTLEQRVLSCFVLWSNDWGSRSFPCKTEMNDNLTRVKKGNSFIGETKNRLENLKQNYVAF